MRPSSWQSGTHCREKFSMGNALPNCRVTVTLQWVQRAGSPSGSERQSMEPKRIILASQDLRQFALLGFEGSANLLTYDPYTWP